MFKRLTSFFAACLISLGVSNAIAAEQAPDATFTLSQGSVGLGVGVSWGEGVLTYKGRQYRFKVDGLSIGDVGIARSELTGDVFNLAQLSNFNGTYASAAAGATLGGGGSAAAMKNQNGVVLYVNGASQGLNLKLATDGVKFKLQG